MFCIVHWTIHCFELKHHLLYLIEGIDMINIIDRSSKIFNINQILLDFIKLMFSVDVINWIVQCLDVCYLSFNILECMGSFFNRVNRTSKLLNRFYFSLNFIKVMLHIYSLSDRIIGLFK